jgi:hypothetical protein
MNGTTEPSHVEVRRYVFVTLVIELRLPVRVRWQEETLFFGMTSKLRSKGYIEFILEKKRRKNIQRSETDSCHEVS